MSSIRRTTQKHEGTEKYSRVEKSTKKYAFFLATVATEIIKEKNVAMTVLEKKSLRDSI
jgi:hypothetical protein